MEESSDTPDITIETGHPLGAREARGTPPEERLRPRDGLNTYHVYLGRLDLEPHGDGEYTFIVTQSMTAIGEFAVKVKGGGRGMDEMAVEALDSLIDIFRQLTFRADKARQMHLRNAARPAEPVAAAADGQDELRL